MLKQKSRARKNWKGTGDVNDSQIYGTRFVKIYKQYGILLDMIKIRLKVNSPKYNFLMIKILVL